ncbi:MAG: hypothetical protein R3B45_06705 [Bdellovibrionota bacterium]
MSNSIIKDAVVVLAKEYPDIDRSTLTTLCKTQFSWSLKEKDMNKTMCQEVINSMVFMRETGVFEEEMKKIALRAREQYRAGIDDLVGELTEEK